MAFIPLYDGNPLRYIRYPYVNWALIAVNALIFFFVEQGTFVDADRVSSMIYGLIPAAINHLEERPEDFAVVPDYLTLVTYSFFHADFWHLAGNMIFLWVFGDNVEDSLGHLRYLFFYLVSAAGAGYAYALSDPESAAPLIGASGAVAGIVAAYLLLHPRAKVWILAFARIPLHISALWVLGFWIVFQVYAVLTAGPDDEVALWAHIGGFVTGAVLVLFLRRRGVGALRQEGAAAGRSGRHVSAAFLRCRGAAARASRRRAARC